MPGRIVPGGGDGNILNRPLRKNLGRRNKRQRSRSRGCRAPVSVHMVGDMQHVGTRASAVASPSHPPLPTVKLRRVTPGFPWITTRLLSLPALPGGGDPGNTYLIGPSHDLWFEASLESIQEVFHLQESMIWTSKAGDHYCSPSYSSSTAFKNCNIYRTRNHGENSTR